MSILRRTLLANASSGGGGGVTCAYPLDDDGSLAAAFGFAHAPANSPDFHRVDYNMGTSAVTGASALTLPAEAATNDIRAFAGTHMVVGVKNISVDGTKTDWWADGSLNVLAMLWNGGSDVVVVNISTTSGGDMILNFGGQGSGAGGPTSVSTGIPWEGSRFYLYVNSDSGSADFGRVGYSINGTDYGYVSGPDASNGSGVASYMVMNNGSSKHPVLDNRNISYEFLVNPESGDETGMPTGAVNLCGNAI